MRPAVVTAVLLLVCIQVTVTAGGLSGAELFFCTKYPDRPCGDGWSRIDDNRCAKSIQTPKTFNDAEEHCRTLNGHLVSLHSQDEMLNLVCLNFRSTRELQTIWIGAQRSGVSSECVIVIREQTDWLEEFRNTDGSEFDYNYWYPGQPDNTDGQDDCIESNSNSRGYWNDAVCSEEKNFVCAKKM